ncbi:MAG: SPFH domain-containing protein [Oscillospiraceae bacterium]|nr:SPFH domain-containing protein [Oscillospiraceae bacterium]
MGFIKAFSGAIGGTFAEQWKDFYTVPNGIGATVGICPAVKTGTNMGRGSNTKGSSNVITNGSYILVPEGFALITMENGAITGFVAEAGGFVWQSDNLNSQSFFSGGGLINAVIKQSWERFKFGGMPGASQQAFYVNLKEIPNNKFGTQSEIYWDDRFLGTQAGALARGMYSLKITDPLRFIEGFVPAAYYSSKPGVFDFADFENGAAEQLFSEVVASLAAAFSSYVNSGDKQNRITKIQSDSVGFAQSLAAAVESGYLWKQDRGLEIVKAAIVSIEYDAPTKELLEKVKTADALMGARGNSFMQSEIAQGMRAAGENPSGGALGMGFMGMGLQGAAGMAGALQQPAQQAAPAEDPYEKLVKLKGLLDQGIITQQDFDAAKAKLLNI